MKYRVICSDLDGTLLNSASELSAENSAALKELYRRGVMLVPTTGRTVAEIPESVMRESEIKYIIYSNGVGIYDVAAGRGFELQIMPHDILEKAVSVIFKYDCFPILHDSCKMYISEKKLSELEKYHFSAAYIKLFENHSIAVPEKFEEFTLNCPEFEMFCLAFANPRDKEACIRELSAIEALTITSSGFDSIEVMMSSAGKGREVVRFSDFLGIPLAKFICVGANTNDIDMLTVAGLSLAVSNGRDETRSAADKVICSCNEHILRYIIENIL